MVTVLKNFRLIDEETDVYGTLVIDNGFIVELRPHERESGSMSTSMISETRPGENPAAMIIDGAFLSSYGKTPVLMPAFVDLHAHFRDPGFPEKENLDSASLSAAAGGFGTVVCMANTRPPIDTIAKAAALKNRSDTLGLIDLYPVLSLTKNMEGKELSEITRLSPGDSPVSLMLSEDGKDVEDDELFLAAMKEAKRIGIPVSCHCDFGGDENFAVNRVIELGKKAGCRIHIAHVSTKEAIETIRQAKAEIKTGSKGAFTLGCEVMPHNLCLTKEDAVKLGETTWGRVNPPLRTEEDRQALIEALLDGTIDAIATDHAPHTAADKEAGAPGFSGFETAFAAVYTELSQDMDLKKISSLMSASPARLLGLNNSRNRGCNCDSNGNCGSDRNRDRMRGRLLPGYRADLVIIDMETSWKADPAIFKSRGKNSAFVNRQLHGKILMTIQRGRVVYTL